MVPRRPPRPCCWTALPGVGSIESPPGWHGLRYAAPSGMVCALIYIIIIGGCAGLYSVRRGWYLLSTSGRVCALQRGTGGIIAAFVGLVSWAVEWVQSQEKPL